MTPSFLLDMAAPDAVANPCEIVLSAGQAGEMTTAAGAAAPARTEPQAVSVLLQFRKWIVIHHRADDGARVRLGLRREGYDVHWPREVYRVPRRDDVLRPFLPGYLFATPLERHLPWQDIRGKVASVVGIVGVREFGKPAPVPVGLVEGLIERAGGAIDGVIPAKEDAAEVWTRGKSLRFSGGAMDGVRCLVEADRGARVLVLFDLLGIKHRVVVRRDQVSVVE